LDDAEVEVGVDDFEVFDRVGGSVHIGVFWIQLRWQRSLSREGCFRNLMWTHQRGKIPSGQGEVTPRVSSFDSRFILSTRPSVRLRTWGEVLNENEQVALGWRVVRLLTLATRRSRSTPWTV
jgi:RNA 3'-terminal phosphate cyclase